MITLMENLPDHVIGIEVSDKLRSEDYIDILVPLVNERLASHDKLDLLVHFQGEWQGMDPAAAWEDMRLALGKLGHWARAAVVSDIGWMATSIKMFRLFWPGELRHFPASQLDEARDWVCERERARVRCTLDAEHGIVEIEPDPEASLSEDDFEAVGEVITGWLKEHDRLRGVLIRSRRFPGWQGIGALFAHLKFVHHVHDKIDRIALVTNSAMGSFADRVLDPLMLAKLRKFDFDEYDKARAWLSD